jgi:hypothetical protein
VSVVKRQAETAVDTPKSRSGTRRPWNLGAGCKIDARYLSKQDKIMESDHGNPPLMMYLETC